MSPITGKGKSLAAARTGAEAAFRHFSEEKEAARRRNLSALLLSESYRDVSVNIGVSQKEIS